MPETAFVTGGSGFIGGRLVQRLVGEGHPVRALARSDAAAAKVAALGAEPIRGDLADQAALTAAADGADVAFHLAAHLGEWGDWEAFERGNVVGTRNVLAACEEAGVKRFVHCGTEAALMAGEPLIGVDETAPPMTTFRSWLLTQECTIDISKARAELDYASIVSHEQGLAELASAVSPA